MRIGLLIAITMVVFGNSLSNGFTMDDRLYIFLNPAVTAPSASGLFAPNEVTALWRPVTFASFALNFAASADHPFLYHLINLLLHAGVTTLVYMVLRKLLEAVPRGRTIAWVTAVLFAVHPIHVEAVTSIVGRAELLAAGFVLAAWLSHLYERPALASFFFVLALLSKESAMALPLMVVAGDYAFAKMKPLRRYLWMVAIACIYIPLLWIVHGGRFGPQVIDFVNNPLAALPADLRILNALRIAWRYIALLVYPAKLSCDYSYNAIPLYASWRHFVPALLATAVTLAIWIWTLLTDRRAWFLAGAIYLAGFSITGNILMVAGPPMGERIAYLPSIGFFMLIALFWDSIDERWPKPAGVLLLLIVSALAARTWVRNRDWRDNTTLFFAAIKVVPESMKVRDGIIGQYVARGDWDIARAKARETLEMYPPFPEEMKTKGVGEYDFRLVKEAEHHAELGEIDDGLGFVNVVIKRSPKFSLAWSERAAIRLQSNDKTAARNDATTALQLDPDNVQAQDVMGFLNGAP